MYMSIFYIHNVQSVYLFHFRCAIFQHLLRIASDVRVESIVSYAIVYNQVYVLPELLSCLIFVLTNVLL